MRLNIRKFKFKEVAPTFLKVFEDYRAHGYVQSAGSMWCNSVKRYKREILLKNAKYSRDPTYKELVAFIKSTRINFKRYVPEKYVCRHFATDLHNKAEKAGIRAGVVYIEFHDAGFMHAINVFDTLDKGLVYIDCTGFAQKHEEDYTAEVKLKVDRTFVKKCIFVNKLSVKDTWIVKRFDTTW